MGRVKPDGKRVNMFWHGPELIALRQAAALFRLNDETAAIRYLVTRGFEAVADKLGAEHHRQQQLQVLREFTQRADPQQWIPGIQAEWEKRVNGGAS